MPFEARLGARRYAPFHLQLELAKLPAQQRVPNEIQIEGKVTRVFRGDAKFLGATVLFPLWVCEKGDEPTGPAFVYYQDLMSARYIEAYLNGSPPQCKLAAYEYVLLPAPSLEPRMSLEELELISRSVTRGAGDRFVRPGPTRKWWQFWRR
jgi:hypothetical protein